MNLFVLGAIAMACFAAGLLFLRYWRETADPLFVLFAISFLLEGLNRTLLAATPRPEEGAPSFYLVRLVSFLLIFYAVLQKNRGGPA